MDDSPLRGVNGREQQHRQQQENGTPRLPQSFSQVLQRNRQKYYDGLVAVVLFFVWQLLICGLQQMTATIDDFPAPILAMLLVAALMILASRLFVAANLDGLYRTYLRGPTDLLNRHMSIGFTVPFTMIMDGPMSSSRNIGLIIAGYSTFSTEYSTALFSTWSLTAASHHWPPQYRVGVCAVPGFADGPHVHQ